MTTIIIVTTGHGFWLWQKTDGISATLDSGKIHGTVDRRGCSGIWEK